MDGIINVKVGGNHVSKDSKNAGVRGEANVTILRITFDEGWKPYSKTVTFFDAQGKNPVKRVETTDLIEDITTDTLTYLTPIPKEALTLAGEITFVIDGYSDGKRKRSVEDKLYVKDSPDTDNAGEPTDVDPEIWEQIQSQIDGIVDSIQNAVVAGENAKASELEALKAEGRTKQSELVAQSAQENAEESAERAEAAALKADSHEATSSVNANAAYGFRNEAEQFKDMAFESLGKTPRIGDNGNWFAWDNTINEFYDTGVKAQSGSVVYIGENPPAEAGVWIKTNGEVDVNPYTSYAYVNIRGGADNWDAEEVKDSTGNVIGYRYGQVVNVNNAVITENSKVDLQINSEQMVVFYQKDLAFVTENDDGVVTVYCVGNIPENDYTVRAVVTEVLVNG